MKRPVFHFIIIAVLGFLVYSNTFDVPFFLDDKRFISENPLIKDFSSFLEPSRADQLDLGGDFGRYFRTRQVAFLSFWLNYKLHGIEKTMGFHLVNLVIHILTALLVYILVLLTFKTPFMEKSALQKRIRPIALFSALIFVCHPIQTQSITYVVQRFASLATLFYLLSFMFYISSRLAVSIPRKSVFYFLCMATAVIGMKTKEIVFTLPFMVALYEFMFLRGSIRQRLAFLLPLSLTLLVIPLTIISLDLEATSLMTDVSRTDYLLTQFRVITTYIRLLFVPIGQNLDYDYPVYHSFFNPSVLLSFLFLLGFFCLGIYMLRHSRTGEVALRFSSFGIFWFFITLSIESSVIPIRDVIFEHRLYLPSVGAFWALCTGAFLLAGKTEIKKITAALAVLIIALSAAAHARNTVWQSKSSLWEDVVRKSPRKLRPQNVLANLYKDKGLYDKAMEHFMIAWEIAPDLPDGQNNIALIYQLKGQTDKAISHYKKALELNPSHIETLINLGIIYKKMGIYNTSMEHFKRALELNPNRPDIHYNVGNLYVNIGMAEKAAEHYIRSLSLRPDDPDTHNNLGIAYRIMGLTVKAQEQFRIAKKLRERKGGN